MANFILDCTFVWLHGMSHRCSQLLQAHVSLTDSPAKTCDVTLQVTHSTYLHCRLMLCSQCLAVLIMLSALGDLSMQPGASCMLSCKGSFLMCSLLQFTFLHTPRPNLVERHLWIQGLAPRQACNACCTLQLLFYCLTFE